MKNMFFLSSVVAEYMLEVIDAVEFCWLMDGGDSRGGKCDPTNKKMGLKTENLCDN
jgi:hypothetical protein